MIRRILATLICGVVLAACSSDDGLTPTPGDAAKGPDTSAPADTARPPDTEPGDTALADTGTTDTSVADTGAADTGPGPDTTPPPQPGTLTFAFSRDDGIFGGDDATVTLYPEDERAEYATDADPGFQVTIVVATTELPEGHPIALWIDASQAATASVDAAGAAAFSGVTIGPDPFSFSVRTTDLTGTELSVTKDVDLVTEACQVHIITDSAGCITADADADLPGFQAAFTVQATGGDCASAALAVTFGGQEQTFDATPFEGGAVTFVVTLADEDAAQGVVQLDATGNHARSPALGGSASATATADNIPAIPVFTQPAAAADVMITLANDVDANPFNGLQYDLVAQVGGVDEEPAPIASVTWALDDVDQGALAADGGAYTVSAHTFTQNGPVALTITATDACGNVAQASAGLTVYSTQPTIAIASPASGILLAKDDGDRATTAAFETTVAIETTDLPDGVEITVVCAAPGAATMTPVATFTTTAGRSAYQAAVTLDTAIFGSAISCQASADWFNPSVSDPVAWTVALPAPTLTLASPAKGDRLNQQQFMVNGQSTGLDGQAVRVVVSDGVTTFFDEGLVNVAQGSYSGIVVIDADVYDLADGDYQVSVTAVDGWGNAIADLQEVPSASFSLDRTAPGVVRNAPQALTLDPVANADHFDQYPDTPGYQLDLSFEMTQETVADQAQLCAILNGVELGCQTPDADDFTVTWQRESLVPGENALMVTAVDGWGNSSAPLVETIVLELDAPVVSVLSPAPGVITTDATTDVVVQVSDSETGTGLIDAHATLLIDGQAWDGVAAAGSVAGQYTFSDAPLSASGATVLQVVAEFSSQEGASAERVITVKTDTPLVTIDDPTDGAVFAQGAAACLGSQTDCATSVSVSYTYVEQDSPTTLTVTCGDKVETYEAQVADGGAYTFADVTLYDGHTGCSIAATVTDAAGQTAAATPVGVTVDRVAPEVVAFTYPEGDKMRHDDDLRPGEEGMQAPLRVRLAGVEAGQTAVATIAWTDPDTFESFDKQVSHEVAADTLGAGETYLASFTEDGVGNGLVHFPEGVVSIVVSVSDAAGNSAQTSKVVAVESNAPSARFTYPGALGSVSCDAASPCSAGVCAAGTCHHGWGIAAGKFVTVQVAGVFTDTDNVRVCSDAASLATGNDPCATAGFYQVAGASSAGGVFVVNLDLPETAQRVIVEVQAEADGPWVSSQTEEDVAARQRDIYVDLQAPTVTALSSPSDDEAPTGVLNRAEQDQDGRVYALSIESDEDGESAVWVNGAKQSDALIANGSVALNVTLAEGANTVYARVTDAVGNVSFGTADAGLLTWTPSVDTQLPSLGFVSPSVAVIRQGDDRDVSVSSDEDGAVVTLYDQGLEAASATVSGGFATFDHASFGLLTDGVHVLSASVVDAAGNAATAVTNPTSVSVDTVPPTVAFTAPSDYSVVTDDSDADPNLSGVQLPVSFSAGGDAATWSVSVASGCTSAYDGCDAEVTAATGDVTAPAIDSVVTFMPSDGFSHYVVTARTFDDAGNSAFRVVRISLLVQNCLVSIAGISDPDWINQADCAGAGACEVTLTGSATGPSCGAVDGVTLVAIAADEGETVVGSDDSLVGGGADFTLGVVDGATLRYRLDARVGSVIVASSDIWQRAADLTPPVVTVTAVIAGTAPTAGLYNASNDTSAAPGFQVSVAVQVTDVNMDGGRVDSIKRDGTAVAPTSHSLPIATTGAFDDTFAGVALVDQSDNTVVVTAYDAAGNVASAQFSAAVDAVAPSTPTLAAIASADVDARGPAVTLRWTAVGDNGATGQATRYEVRYGRSAITDAASFDAACSAANIAHAAGYPTPAEAGGAQAYTVAGPDARDASEACKFGIDPAGAAMYFALRVTDDAGNHSVVTAASAASTTALTLTTSRITFDPTFLGAQGIPAHFQGYMGSGGATIGDVDNDGVQDFASGFFLTDGFCIFSGGAFDGDYEVAALSGAHHSCQFKAASLVPDAGAKDLGSFFDALGDVNGDGIDDFGVSGKTTSAEGFVAVYFGKDGVRPDLSAPELIIRGIDALGGDYGGFCGAGNFDGATDPAVASEIAVGEPATDRLHVIPGDTSWTSGQATVVIDLDAADVATTFGIHRFDVNFTDTTAWFGLRCQKAGDVLPTPGGGPATSELLVLAPNEVDSRLFVLPGRPLVAGAVETLTKLDGVLTAEDQRAVVLRQEEGLKANGWGASFRGDTDLNGDGVPDIFVANAGRSTSAGGDGKVVHIFDGGAMAAAVGGNLRVGSQGSDPVGGSWYGDFGTVVGGDLNSQFRSAAIVGNYDGWMFGPVSTPDIAIADKSFGTVSLHMNQETDGGESTLGLYPYTEATFGDPAGGAFGLWVDSGVDADGDGREDVIVGTIAGGLVIIH